MVYLQRIAARLSKLSNNTNYDQFYSQISDTNLQQLNFSKVSDELQLVNLVEKFLSLSLKPSSSLNSPTSRPNSTTPSSPSRPASVLNKYPIAPVATNVPSQQSNVESKPEPNDMSLSQKARHVSQSLSNYICSYKYQTALLKVFISLKS